MRKGGGVVEGTLILEITVEGKKTLGEKETLREEM